MDVIWKNITSFRGDCRFWQSIISDFLIWLHRNINLLESATPPIPEFVFKKMLESTSESFPICICFDPSIYCFMLVWRENARLFQSLRAQLLLVFVWASLPFSFNIQKQQEDLNSWKFYLKKDEETSDKKDREGLFQTQFCLVLFIPRQKLASPVWWWLLGHLPEAFFDGWPCNISEHSVLLS